MIGPVTFRAIDFHHKAAAKNSLQLNLPWRRFGSRIDLLEDERFHAF